MHAHSVSNHDIEVYMYILYIYTPLSEGSSNIIGNTGVGTIHISMAWNVLTVYQIDKESRSTTEQVVHTPGHSPLSFT